MSSLETQLKEFFGIPMEKKMSLKEKGDLLQKKMEMELEAILNSAEDAKKTANQPRVLFRQPMETTLVTEALDQVSDEELFKNWSSEERKKALAAARKARKVEGLT